MAGPGVEMPGTGRWSWVMGLIERWAGLIAMGESRRCEEPPAAGNGSMAIVLPGELPGELPEPSIADCGLRIADCEEPEPSNAEFGIRNSEFEEEPEPSTADCREPEPSIAEC
jgi:hypothetical protein